MIQGRWPALPAALLACAVPLTAANTATAQTPPVRLTVTSPTLVADRPMPRQHTPDGRNDSPALAWSGAPAATKEFAVVCEDPDAGNPPPFVHWVLYKIPPTATGLPEALPFDGSPLPASLTGAVQGLSGFRRPYYRGPAPPPGKPHHYHFIVYALDTALPAPTLLPMTRAELLGAMKGHIIGQGEIVSIYERK
jgi:Raf kinase inhibitor-like YbhB/YbcL family protein